MADLALQTQMERVMCEEMAVSEKIPGVYLAVGEEENYAFHGETWKCPVCYYGVSMPISANSLMLILIAYMCQFAFCMASRVKIGARDTLA